MKRRHCEEERRSNLLLIVQGLKDCRGRKLPRNDGFYLEWQ
jgi:hypothetical protein